jgi:hypothetical protein
VPFLRELITNMAAARPTSDSTLLARKTWLGTALCASENVVEGERIAREVLTTAPARDSTNIRTARRAIDACQARLPKPN